MAVGEMIGAAIGILMLIIVAYLVVGSTLSTAEMVVNTQKDITLQNEARLNTAITIPDVHSHTTSTFPYYTYRVDITVSNSGSESIGDFDYMDIYITNATAAPMLFMYDSTAVGTGGSYYTRKWSYTSITTTDTGDSETIHPGMLDPGESMDVIRILNFRWNPDGALVTVITSNGASASGIDYWV